jgi:hypothetical protein|nr:MAG TPA: hypothetical protein [Caudoviricetes sp.]
MTNKDTLIKMFEGIRDERTKHANTARRIGNAFLSMLDFASSAGDGKLSSVHDDIAQGFITFVKGLMSNQLAQLKGGASFGSDGSYSFDKDGNLVIESARSRDFDEMLQNGFALKRNPTSGKYTLSISDLIVWGRMVINTLETRKKYAIGGNVYLSGASSKIQHVEKVYSEDGETVVGYKCYILKDDGTMATQNNWVVGDQALCQTFDIEEGVYQNVSNQYYWRLVTQVSEENVAITEKYIDKDGNEQIRELYEGQKFAWVVLSKDDCDKNSGVPASGDTIVLDGHRLTENEDIDYTERTNVLMLEATGSGSPRIIALTGVVDYKHTTDNEVFILSPQKVIFTTEHFEIRTASGAPITFVHFMGPWVKGTEYHYYDQVSHANALWTCIVEKGKSTTDEPTDRNTYWRKEMSGGKGEKGDDAVSYILEASPGYIRLNSDRSIDYTNGYIDKGDEYGSDKYLVVRGYKVAKGVRDNRFSTEENPVTLRLTINDGSAYSEYTPSDGDSVSIDFEPKYGGSYYSMLQEISHSGLNSVRVDMCEGSEYNTNKILATCDIPIIQNGKDGQKGDDAVSYNINFVTYKDDVHNDTLLYVYVVRSVGKESTSTLISNIPEISETAGLEVRVYCDGDYNENLTNHVKWSGSIQRSAWETVKNFEVRLYLNDKLVTSNSYSFGEQGESALEIIVTPETLVFDTDDSGLVPSGTSKQASISCYRNGVKVTNVSYIKSVEKNCSASVSESNSSATVTISEITSQEVADKSGNSSTISNTSGYATIRVWDKDTNLYHRVQVKFMVNVAKFTGQMVNTNKRFSLQHEELVNDVKDKVGSSELMRFKGEITQTAREISLSVSEKSIARRNLLVGSAFLREDNNVKISDGARIEMNSGYQGTNCIKVIDELDGTNHYIGAFWDGGIGGKSIKITKGKKYVISCWCKTNDKRAKFYIEPVYTDKQTNAKRLGRATLLSSSSWIFEVKEVNTWQLFTSVIDTTDGLSDYIGFNFWETCAEKVGHLEAWICRMMVEEGTEYNGWTLSEKDYDFIGANLIDNSRTFDLGGNIKVVKGTKKLVGDAYELSATLGDDYNTFYMIGNEAFELDTDYTLSFEVKGDAKYMGVYAYYKKTDTPWLYYKEQQDNPLYEKNGDGKTEVYVGLLEEKYLAKQHRVWVHFKFKKRLPEYIYFQFPKNTEQTDVTSWNVTITRPKLEEGAVVTEYTERKSDLVDKATLKKAGIEITSDQVILYGNKVQVKNPKENPSEGYDEAAMFQNGKLNAQFINAGEVVSEGINAKKITATKLNVTGDSKIGIWHITKVDGWGDVMQAEGTEYNGATVVSGIQYCPLFVRGGSPNTAYFRVGASCTEFSYQSTLNHFNAVWFGNAAGIVCKGSVNSVDLPTNYSYNTQYEPVQYIFSEQSKKDSPALAINVIAKGFSGTPTAIQTNGAIRGVLAPNVMSISWDQTISNGVGVVICTNSYDITLTLPVNPVEGQTLIIIQGSSGKVYIVPPNGKEIHFGGSIKHSSDIGNNRFWSGSRGQFNILVFINDAWQLQFVNNRP